MSNKLIKGPFIGPTTTSSNGYLQNRSESSPFISPESGSKLSDYRKSELTSQIDSGMLKEGSQAFRSNSLNGYIKTASVAESALPIGSSIKKHGQVAASGNYRGSNDTVNQAPSIYSPLWNDSNLSLPRDKATINAWCRNFFALNRNCT